MLDMSWGEVMVIGAVALVVIGPKDLPKALRTVGSMVSKVRRMAAEFQGQFNEAMREAELDDVKRQLQGMNDSVGSLNQNFNPMQTIRDELKGSIEAPATPKSPGITVSDAPETGTPLVPALEPSATLHESRTGLSADPAGFRDPPGLPPIDPPVSAPVSLAESPDKKA